MAVLLDQHLMVDLKTIAKVVEAAGLAHGERVLEIGAGTGNLTRMLALAGAKVIAVELDPQLAAMLRERFSYERNVEIAEGNALRIIRKLRFDKIVSNIPYAICEPLLKLLKETCFKEAVITVPEGFLKRLASDTMLGLESRIFFDMKKLFNVPKKAFAPPPCTESVAISIKPAGRSIIKSVLSTPKAKLKNAIMEALVERDKCTKNHAREAIKAMDISNIIGEKRAVDMNLNELRQLISKFKETKY